MNEINQYQSAVDVIKTAILQSQARAAKAVNQEQLALYYGIGRYVSANTRKKNWGTGAIEAISSQLRKELPGLRGFSAPSLRKMRIFYEEWMMLERNSFVPTNEFTEFNTVSAVATAEIPISNEIHQLQLANSPQLVNVMSSDSQSIRNYVLIFFRKRMILSKKYSIFAG